MRWSYRIARVSGIDVKIHVTFLLLLAWYGWASWQEGGPRAVVPGVGFILLLFLCVLLHEFGHALAARMYGIRTPDITLLPIGGVARLERMPDKPWQELVVAVAGPAVNVGIAGVLFLAMAAKFSFSDLAGIDRPEGSVLVKLMAVNVMLVVFNAIPAFPMDGGRILRALLAMRFKFVVATTVAARVGQVIAILFLAAGFFGSPMLMFIGIFVFLAAQQELNYARFRSAVSSRRVSETMRVDFVSFPPDVTCARAAEITRGATQAVFPVVDNDLRALGVVRSERLANAPDPWAPVAELMEPAARVQSSMPVAVFAGSFGSGTQVLVENSAGQIVGLAGLP
jgi:Zn-dependent protease